MNFLRFTFNGAYHTSSSSNKREVNRVCWEIKEADVQRATKWDCKQVFKSCSMHCINGYSGTINKALMQKDNLL